MTPNDQLQLNQFLSCLSPETEGVVMCQTTGGGVSYVFIGKPPIVSYLAMCIQAFILKPFMETIKKPSSIVPVILQAGPRSPGKEN